MSTQKHTPMFKAALVILVKKWEQPKYPLPDEWINKMVYKVVHPHNGRIFGNKNK